MKINFHILDGIKIGGIENLALTLTSEENDKEQNYLINLNKKIDNYSDYFSKNNKYKNLKIISCERKFGLLIIPLLTKLFSKLKTKEDYILWLNITKRGTKLFGLNENLSYCRKVPNSLSSSSVQKIIDGYRVYRYYLNYSVIKSIVCLFILSLNFLLKK